MLKRDTMGIPVESWEAELRFCEIIADFTADHWSKRWLVAALVPPLSATKSWDDS